MGLMRRPEDLIVNLILTRGPGENYHIPPLLYIDDPRVKGARTPPHEHFHSLELSSQVPSPSLLLGGVFSPKLPEI